MPHLAEKRTLYEKREVKPDPLVYEVNFSSCLLSLKNVFFGEAKRYFRGEEYCHSAATPGPGSPHPMKTNRRKSEKPTKKLKKTSKKLQKTQKNVEKTLKTLKKSAKTAEFPRGSPKFP